MSTIQNAQAPVLAKPRKLKIAELYRRRADDIISVPQMRLEGMWLEEMGFNIGDEIIIDGRFNQLTITLVNPKKFKPNARKKERWSNPGRCILT
jgi:toxic protein SymE